MKNTPKDQLGPILLWVGLAPLLVIGGLGTKLDREMFTVVGIGLSAAAAILSSLYSVLKRPDWLWGFAGALTVYVITYFWLPVTTWSVTYFLIWVMGGVWGVLSFTFRDQKEFRKTAEKVMLTVGCLFFLMTVIQELGIIPSQLKGYMGLVGVNAPGGNHYHLGDWWMIMAIIFGVRYYRFRSKTDLGWAGLGLLIVLLSQSRSAILGLMLAMFLAGIKFGWNKKYVWQWRIGMGILLAGLWFWSSLKGLVFARPYLIQAIEGVIEKPMGIGMGQFYLVSRSSEVMSISFWGMSNYVHNLWLEWLVGLGILGLVWVGWMVITVGRRLRDIKSLPQLTYVLALTALSLNFLLDITYIIPAMVLIWFVLLGLSGESKA